MLMEGQAGGLVCADPGERTPISMSGNYEITVTPSPRIKWMVKNSSITKLSLLCSYTQIPHLLSAWPVSQSLLNTTGIDNI